MSTKRFENAALIWGGGASNPRAVARALVDAIDESVEEGQGTAAANDPAVHLILDQLAFLVGLPQPTLAAGFDWRKTVESVKAASPKAAALL